MASLMLCTTGLSALDLWRHPEIAEKNSIFIDIGMAPFIFSDFEFPILPLEVRIDYLPPLPLPFSTGLFFKTPQPNLKTFGTRLAYHFDLRASKTDLFLAYVFDIGFIRNDLLEEYNDTPVAVHYYDFRVGVRHFFGPLIGVACESDFKVGGLILLVSVKIH